MERYNRPGRRHLLALGLAVLAISTGAVFVRLADAPAIVIAFYRCFFAFLLLAPIACLRDREGFRRFSWNDGYLGILSGLCLAAHFTTWIASLNYTTVANSVVLVNTSPLWVGLITTGWRRGVTDASAALHIFLGLGGCFLLCYEDMKFESGHLYGDLLAIVGAVFMAAYLIVGRILRLRTTLLLYVTVCYGTASVVLGLSVFITGSSFIGYSWGTLGSLAAMACISQVFGHTVCNWVLRWFDASFVAICLLGEPILASIFAYFLFAERLSALQFVGAALVLLGIGRAIVAESSRKRLERGTAVQC